MTDLSRMIELARGHSDVVSVLFSSGEFTRAEIIEHLPDVIDATRDPIRQGVVS